jgi:hypothetical protein
MAEPDDLNQLSLDRPVRPGEMFLPKEGFKYPNPQLLRRQARTKATTLLPELEQNFQYALDVTPMSRSGFGQGTRIKLDPDLPILESRIVPWFGRVDSPEYMDELRRTQDSLEKARAAMPALKQRHAREFERQVSTLGHALRQFGTQGLGTTIRMGLANPNVATSELNVRDAHMIMAYLMGRNLPPESASMDLTRQVADRSVGRHAARLGLQVARPDPAYVMGAPLSEHVRGLELGFGTKGQGHLLAGLGLKSDTDIFGVQFEEQFINKGQPLNPFSRKLVEGVMADRERVAQSELQLTKATSSKAKFREASVAYRNALESFLDDVFNQDPPSQTPGLKMPKINVPKDVIQESVNNSFKKTFRQGMEPFGTRHLDAVRKDIRETALGAIRDDHPRAEYVRLRFQDMKRGVDEYLIQWVRSQKTFQAPRRASKATLAAEGGVKSVVNPVTKTMSEGVPARATNLKRLEQGTAQVLKQLGRTAPNIPMFLVTALAAGLAVTGFTREDSDV